MSLRFEDSVCLEGWQGEVDKPQAEHERAGDVLDDHGAAELATDVFGASQE